MHSTIFPYRMMDIFYLYLTLYHTILTINNPEKKKPFENNTGNGKQDSCQGTTCQAHVTLTLGLPEQMFQMAHVLMMENNCTNLYENPSKIVGVMVQTKI